MELRLTEMYQPMQFPLAMKLSTYLDIKKLSAADFAALLTGDASEASVRKWASGERIPRADMIREIATVTDGMVLPNDFFGIGFALEPVGDHQPTEGN